MRGEVEDFFYVILLLSIFVFGGIVRILSAYSVDKHMKKLAQHLEKNGSSDLSVVTSGLTYFGSMMGSYNGVYIEMNVEKLEADSLVTTSGRKYRPKPFLCYTLTYKGTKRSAHFRLTEAALRFKAVQESLLSDIEELLSMDEP